jgi:D-tyrosyl-tRNA(Tyr) deacylase
MRAVIQRVKGASVTVDGAVLSRIGMGLCCLVGIEAGDGPSDIDYLARKICSIRIFDDENGVMNLDVSGISGEILLISQFTLHGDARKGRRPSYSKAEAPESAREKFEGFILKVKELYPGKVETGKFQAMMDVSIINHGPVTILLDSKKLF